MKKMTIKSLGRYINFQKIAALFFVLLILTAYSLTIKDNGPLEIQKQKIINAVTNQQENSISTLTITSLPFWFALGNRLKHGDK